MHHNRLHGLTRTTTLAALLAAGLSLSGAAAQPDQILLGGQLRDFKNDHADFGLGAGSGPGVAFLVDTTLGTDGDPLFLGAGMSIDTRALDAAGEPIAPHLYSTQFWDGSPLVLESPPALDHDAVIDTYDPAVGYDPATAGPVPDLPPFIPNLDPISPPAMGVAKVASYKYSKDGDFTIAAGDYWCDTFEVLNNTTLVIDGDVRIRADATFRIRNGCTIYILPGGSLEMWVGGSVEFMQHTSINEDLTNAAHFDPADDTLNWDHTNCFLYNFGTETIVFDNATDFKGTVVSPNAPVDASNDAQVYGSVWASSLTVDNTSGIHLGGTVTFPSTCFAEGDIQAGAGAGSKGMITGEPSFNQWFREVPGINMPDLYQMFFDFDGTAYEFQEADWRPADDTLYGNENGTANRGFTFETRALFYFTGCDGQFLEIETSLDAWVYIDGELVIDLGGNTGIDRQRIEVDRLGLADGLHEMKVFIASRTTDPAPLRLSTTIPLSRPRDAEFLISGYHD